ncbi:MAG: ABC transporter ATP-binding protein [Solobacterium sp.]|nr:ABC transporter ATP-binding protein [Solobacterium sp.]
MTEVRPLLEVRDMRISIPTQRGIVHAVNGISYQVNRGEVMGIIGESGSGKSVSSYAVMHLMKKNFRVDGGQVLFDGEDILALSDEKMQPYRGGKISMIFQDPLSCLDPVYTIGRQLTETVLAHEKVTKEAAEQRAVNMLKAVGLRDAEQMMNRYSFEISGGMRQRVMIAIALICDPELLIADEPTTALDVTVQDQILRLLRTLVREKHMSMVFITHNFSVAAQICDSVSVMYGGYILEQGPIRQIFSDPVHPYTQAILRAMPRMEAEPGERLMPIEGEPIDPIHMPSGCPFHPRCTHAMDICRERFPDMTEITNQHRAYCHLLKEGDHE